MLINYKGEEIEVPDNGVNINKEQVTQLIRAMLASFSMTKQRCLLPSCRDYKYYGGRGIKIDPKWLENSKYFLIDVGLRPNGYTLERIDVNGDYTKSNCKWATRKEQSLNTRANKLIEWQGDVLTISEWARRLGMAPRTLNARFTKLGYSVAEAFTKDVKPGGLLPGRVYPKVEQSHAKKGRTGHRLPPKLTRQHRYIATVFEWLGVPKCKIAKEFGTTGTTIAQLLTGTGAYDDSNPLFK